MYEGGEIIRGGGDEGKGQEVKGRRGVEKEGRKLQDTVRSGTRGERKKSKNMDEGAEIIHRGSDEGR